MYFFGMFGDIGNTKVCTQFLSIRLVNALAAMGLTMFRVYVLQGSCNMEA